MLVWMAVYAYMLRKQGRTMSMDASTAYESRSIKVLRYAIIAVALLAVMLPILWILVSSLKPSDEIFQIPPQYIPREVTLEHYNALLRTLCSSDTSSIASSSPR